jgi:hypothetical protein
MLPRLNALQDGWLSRGCFDDVVLARGLLAAIFIRYLVQRSSETRREF